MEPVSKAEIATPEVSVIVPVYNTEDYLPYAIESILNQSHCVLELICIDDGSTDDSPAILDNYAPKDARMLVRHVANGGQGRARNIGLSLAQGEYVYFLDSDDYLTETALEELYEVASTSKLDVLYAEGSVVAEDGKRHDDKQYIRNSSYCGAYKGDELFRLMFKNGDYFTTPCMCLIRREYLLENEIGFPEGHIHEDEAFSMLTLALASRASVMPLRHYMRRYRAGSTMTTPAYDKSLIGYLNSWRCIANNTKVHSAEHGDSLACMQSHLAGGVWRIMALSKMSIAGASCLASREGFGDEFQELVGGPCLRNTAKLNAVRLKIAIKRLLGRG